MGEESSSSAISARRSGQKKRGSCKSHHFAVLSLKDDSGQDLQGMPDPRGEGFWVMGHSQRSRELQGTTAKDSLIMEENVPSRWRDLAVTTFTE